MDPEVFADLTWPENGLDIGGEFGGQRPGTARAGQNVRTFEPTTDRSRGGQRAGLARYINDTVGAFGDKVQHLNIIVDPQAAAVASDDGTDNADSTAANRNLLNAGVGGAGLGGYQVVRKRHPTLTPLSVVLSPSTTIAGTADSVSLTATVYQGSALYPGQAVTLTATSGTGNGSEGISNGSGLVTFAVSDPVDETVTYQATLGPAAQSNKVNVQYVDSGYVAVYHMALGLINPTIVASASINVSVNGESIASLASAGVSLDGYRGITLTVTLSGITASNTLSVLHSLTNPGAGTTSGNWSVTIGRIVSGATAYYHNLVDANAWNLGSSTGTTSDSFGP